MIKRSHRVLSYLLSFSIFLTAFTGLSVQTAQASPQPASERSAPPSEEELGLEDPIDETDLLEISSLRSRDSKTFRNKDGLNFIALYEDAVHYRDGEQWKNIDNTLSDGAPVEGVAVLGNKANDFSVKFAKNTKANFLGMLQKGKYSLKWSLSGAKEAPVQKVETTPLASDVAWDLPGIRSSVRYGEILPATDLEYVVSGSVVKENLILKQAGLPASYTFSYQLSNLSAREEDGRIRFYATKDPSREIWSLAAPFVYDAKDESTDASLSLKDLGNGKIEVTVSVDPAWLSSPERVYPVVIDPPLRTSSLTPDIQDAHVSRLAPDKNFTTTDYLSIGSSDTPGSLCRVYLKFNLPSLDASDVVVDAKLHLLTRTYLGTGESEVHLHKVTSPWNDATVTWNNVPTHESLIGEYDRFSAADEPVSFDVTGMVREWYNEGQNHGVMIKNADETGKFATFRSGATTLLPTDTTRPYITMAYVNNDGLEPYWDYQSASAGRAGTVHVNYFTGALTLTHPDTGASGNRLPAPVTHVFGNTKATDNKYGLGWRLNYSQTIKEMNFGGVTYYRYFDEDGTAHYFVQDTTSEEWVEENDDGWKLTINSASTAERFKLAYKSGNTLTFRYDTVHGLLSKITFRKMSLKLY